jgi:hypothetical protein
MRQLPPMRSFTDLEPEPQHILKDLMRHRQIVAEVRRLKMLVRVAVRSLQHDARMRQDVRSTEIRRDPWVVSVVDSGATSSVGTGKIYA